MRRYYITTPIYYVNDVPHLGTAYTTVAADALRRYHLLRGDATRMLTGTDEHGQKMEREAQARGVSPAEFVRGMSDRFEAAWPHLEVQADDFIRTTQERHQRAVQELWRTVEGRGDIYEGTYEGWYCSGCEAYKTEKDLLPGGVCPLHQRPVEWLKEETCFFRLSKYADALLAHYRAHPEFVAPEGRRNEVLSFVEGGLKDLSVSRTSIGWGVPVPGRPKHVMYVWFDALGNYWSAQQGSTEHRRFWDEGTVVHLIGKDILRFHAVYWPAILMSAGLKLPDRVFAHGFLTYGGQKMSKSLRNAVDPIGIARAFGNVAGGAEAAGADVLRYQLLRAIAFGQDGDFDPRGMIERYNADLGKNLGNLLSRTLGLCAKMTGGKVPPKGEPTALERELEATVDACRRELVEAWEAIEPHRALERTWAIASAANQYVDRAAPWAQDKAGNRARVEAILHELVAILEELSISIWPVLPTKADEMRRALGLPPVEPAPGKDWFARGAATIAPGRALSPSAALFPVVDDAGARVLLDAMTPRLPAEAGAAPPTVKVPAAVAEAAPATKATGEPAEQGAQVTYDQFAAVDLRVGVVQACERVPNKDKLLRLTVDVGEARPRTIVAGLALSFQPADLVGRRVVVVVNLAPRDFGKGLVSHGMVLATGPSERLSLATVDGEVAPGARLR